MAKKIIIEGSDLLQSLTDPWGGFNDTDHDIVPYSERGATTVVPPGVKWGMNRGEVERFNKLHFGKKKVGCLYITQNKQPDNYYHVWGFATEETRDIYLANPAENPELRLADEAIPINEEQGTTFSARLTLLDISGEDPVELDTEVPIVSVTRLYKIGVRFCGIQNDNGEISNANEPGTLVIQRSTDGFATPPTTVATMRVTSWNVDSNNFNEVDLGQWFTTTNPQQFRFRVSFDKTDDDGNVIATAQSSWQVIQSVTYTQLSVQNLTNWKDPIDAESSNNTLTLNFAVQGQIRKWLHVIVSGSRSNYSSTFEMDANTEYNAANPFVLQLYESSQLGILTHGVHTITAWVTADDGSGHLGSDGNPDGLTSEIVINRLMVVNTVLEGINGDYTTAEDLIVPRLMLQQVKTEAQNFVRIVLARYAVWVPDPANPSMASQTALPVSIRITDEAENDTDYTVEYVRNEVALVSRTEYAIDTTIEIEGSQDPNLLAYLRVFRYDANNSPVNFMGESVPGLDFVTINVDNSQNFSPTVGADFVLSPRTRNNSEANKFTIVNQQNGEFVPATFRGFGGINDLWTEDGSGQKVLRVLAGSEVEIEYDPWSHFANNPNAAATIEFDFAVRNITAEDEPAIDITQEVGGETLGLRMLPLEGTVKCVGRQATNDQDFKWEEDARTHLVLTINPSVIAKGDDELTWQRTWNDAPSLPLSLAKVYINGDPRRAVDYSPSLGVWVSGNGHTIKIGNPNADIDIYGAKFYRFALSAEQVRQNRKSALPTAAEKVEFENRNAITTNGRIDYNKAKTKGYRCLTLVGRDQYKNNQNKDGYPCYWRMDHDLAELSGTIGKAAYLAWLTGNLGNAKCLMVTPQGSTANTYWDNNEQTKIDGITYVIRIPFSKVHADFGWKPAKSTGDDCANPMYLDGERIEGTGYADLTDEEKARVTIDVVDGWFDGNGWSENVGEMGMYHGQFYTSYVGGAKCTKVVNKINYASPMQSHKMGATRLYHDLMQAVTGGNSLTRAGARFSVYEESFLFFTEDYQDNGKVEFRGMCTFGNGKFDKAVFGYKADDRTFAFEGLNNNLPLCDFRVPADESVTYNPGDEAWCYNDTKSFEYGLGATQKINGEKYPTETNDRVFRRYVNFIYTHCTSLRYYSGTKEQFVNYYNSLVTLANAGNAAENKAAQAEVEEMQKYQYWPTQNSPQTGTGRCNLLRYDFLTSGWVDAGRFDQESTTYYTAGVRNLQSDPMTQAAYEAWDVSVNKTNAKLNEAFIAAIAQHAVDNFSLVARVDNHQTHYNVVNFLMAGTDNCSKNTYYQYDPEDGLIWLDQDDLDSIWPTDNNGRQTKVYFLDRIHDVADYEAGYKPQIDYEGRASVLFNLIEKAYESDSNNALRQNMKVVLDKMVSLVDGNEGYGDPSAMACLRKYFLSIQEYFPEVAYAEQARLRYEWPKSFGYTSQGNQARNIDPITQQVGSQLENERQYMKRRMVLIATYACWGNITGVDQHMLGITDAGTTLPLSPGSGNSAPNGYKFRLVPHQWIYPTGFVQRNAIDPHVRVAPGAINMPNGYFELTVGSSGIGGDDSAGLAALNYYRKIGNVGNFTVSTAVLQVNAKRLTEFVAEPEPGSESFVPSGIELNTPNLQRLSLNGCLSMVGSKDYSSLTRVEEIDIRGTNITSVVLPTSQLIETLRLPATMTSVALTAQPNLTTFTMEGYAALESLTITGSPLIDTKTLVTAIYTAQLANPVLTTLTLKDIEWTGLNINVLMWMADLNTINLNGSNSIDIYEPDLYQSVVTFDRKLKIIHKWGNVDQEDSPEHQGLKLIYHKINLTDVYVTGNFYPNQGDIFQFAVMPNPPQSSEYSNSFTKVVFSTERRSGLSEATITEDGLFEATEVSESESVYRVTATLTNWYNGQTSFIQSYRDIDVYNRKAKLGDYVYHDGTYSSDDNFDGQKKAIGICCYTAPEDSDGNIVEALFNPADRHKRLMVALKDVSDYFSTWQWGCYYNTGGATYDLFDFTENHNKLQIVDAQGNVLLSTSSFYDVPTIGNYTSHGMATNYITDENMRDETSTLGRNNHGFKPYAPTLGAGDGVTGGVGDGDYAETSGRIASRTLAPTNGINSPTTTSPASLELAGPGWNYQEGDIVNMGYARTLKIIEQRNKIISNGIIVDTDGNGNPVKLGPYPLPQAGENGYTELNNLCDLIRAIRNDVASFYGGASNPPTSKWSQILFPAASAAYAYEPDHAGFELDDRFKAHNWFMPAPGLMARIYWYQSKGLTGEASEKNIFKKATNRGVYTRIVTSSSNTYYYWCSAESNSNYAWYIRGDGHFSTYYPKFNDFRVRAVAAF